MQSLRSRFINALIRNRHFLQGKLHCEIFTKESSIQAFREQCERSARKMSRIPKGVRIEPIALDGITAERLIPEGASTTKIIMYVHGGGYVSGSCADHRGFVATFAKRLGFITLTYNYRLAPEYPYPAAVTDSVAIYRAILRMHRPEDILVAGESAGGGLCLALLLALKQNHLRQPCAAVAITPWTDLTCSSPGYHTRNAKSVAPKDSWKVFSHHYAQETDRRDPLVSPLYGELSSLPPILINAGTDDELYDDSEEFARKASEAGVAVTFRAGKGMVHCYPLLAPMFPEAVKAMTEIADFAKKHLNAE